MDPDPDRIEIMARAVLDQFGTDAGPIAMRQAELAADRPEMAATWAEIARLVTLWLGPVGAA